MTSPIVQSLNLKIKGVDPLTRIAGLIVLAMEIESRKLKLGFKGAGGWQQFRDETIRGERQTFEEFCRDQTGYTAESVAHFHKCADAVRMRLRISSKPGANDLLQDMETPPSEMTKGQRLSLVDRIVSIGLVHGDTQSYLRKEFKAARLPGDETTHRVRCWLADDVDEIRKRAIGMKPVVEEEIRRRHTPEFFRSVARIYMDKSRRTQP